MEKDISKEQTVFKTPEEGNIDELFSEDSFKKMKRTFRFMSRYNESEAIPTFKRTLKIFNILENITKYPKLEQNAELLQELYQVLIPGVAKRIFYLQSFNDE